MRGGTRRGVRGGAVAGTALIVLVAVASVAAAGCGKTATSAGRESARAAADLGVVPLDSGRVSGARADGVSSFLGIPYAAPPVGRLRWAAPQPPAAWSGVRACVAYGPSCPQPASVGLGGFSVGRQSEDCLYLNVWTPAPSAGAALPVMVFVHGGGFTTGSGSLALYDGHNLARRGVVLVTFNYRLGPLGFLATPALSRESGHAASGDYGLLDQIAALQWVRRNIAAFGGDPRRVTLFGESAGAMSVLDLMTSPPAAGLFQRAIAESGPFDVQGMGVQAVRSLAQAQREGERIARAVGVDPADTAALRRVTPQALWRAAALRSGPFAGELTFGPVVDGYVLPRDPGRVFAAGDQQRVPLLVGANGDEANAFLAFSPVTAAQLHRQLAASLGPALQRLLPLFAPVPGHPLARLSKLITVTAFVAPARFAAAAQARAGVPSYLYFFTHAPQGFALGAVHGIELPYVFGNPVLTLDVSHGVEGQVSGAVMGYWTRFAATGDPNGGGAPVWPRYDGATDRYLELGTAIAPRVGLYARACAIADEFEAGVAVASP